MKIKRKKIIELLNTEKDRKCGSCLNQAAYHIPKSIEIDTEYKFGIGYLQGLLLGVFLSLMFMALLFAGIVSNKIDLLWQTQTQTQPEE